MSLRKQARILGIAPSYLSMLVNGKRKWPDDLRYRYEELVNSTVNTSGGTGETEEETNLKFVPKKEGWWSWGDSNPLPHPCKGCALPDELQPHLVSREFHPLIRFLQVLLYLGCAVTGNRQKPCFVCYGLIGPPQKMGWA